MTESSSFAMESVAAQDTKQGHPQGHGTGNNHSHVTNIDGESQPTHPHNGKADRLQGMFKGIEIEHKTRDSIQQTTTCTTCILDWLPHATVSPR